MSDYMSKYNDWINSDFVSSEDKEELKKINGNEKEIEDRFYKDLSFGTGGMRGVRGVGSNRINVYTVMKATQGLADYMLKVDKEKAINSGVIIAHDCRIGSKEYTISAAKVLAANGIKTYIYEDLRSTPELSFGVRYKGAMSGIVITASHNPREYNGYKVYWEDGAQAVDPYSTGIVNEVNNIESFDQIKVITEEEAKEKKLIITLDSKIDNDYINEIKKQSLNNIEDKSNLKIVYTPLHGTGGRPMERVFKEFGYSYEVVKEQIQPDGNFPTVEYANPEEVAAFALGVKTADEVEAKLVMANDPDADRIGIAIKDNNNNWYYPNGNQVGLLLLQYLINNKKDIPKNAKIITTIVSTPMIDVIAADKNIDLIKTLTGFKYIGEKIKQFENKEIDGEYLFGFEESYGYLVGTHARDKDAIVSSLVIAEMALYYDSIGSSIYEELQKLYEKYGYYLEGIKSVTLKGKDGTEQILAIMKSLRDDTPSMVAETKVSKVRDFENRIEEDIVTGKSNAINLPVENVMQFELEDGTLITARPSGTEPKIKFYFAINSDTKENAENKLDRVMKEFIKYLNLE